MMAWLADAATHGQVLPTPIRQTVEDGAQPLELPALIVSAHREREAIPFTLVWQCRLTCRLLQQQDDTADSAAMETEARLSNALQWDELREALEARASKLRIYALIRQGATREYDDRVLITTHSFLADCRTEE